MIPSLKILICSVILLTCEMAGFSSEQIKITGQITDTTGAALEKASISLLNTNTGTYSDANGYYSINIEKNGILIFSHVGYRSEKREVNVSGGSIVLNIVLSPDISSLDEIKVVSPRYIRDPGIIQIPLKDIRLLPSASGSFEAVIKTMPGVSSRNELSTQYSVRGGSYDENLVYINDVEIYRPFLIRSGQQEGLSIINSDLAGNVKFSPGGFDSSYGDKMSSVLDITYKRPVTRKGSLNLGLLTSSVHYEGVSRDQKLRYLAGVRYKSSRLMLKTLDSKGNYNPVFGDIQSQVTYRTGQNSELSFLGTFSSNRYNFEPESRTSTFGTELTAYQLFVLFNGMERNTYKAWNTALGWEFSGDENIKHKILFSSFGADEKEYYDIRSSYSLRHLDMNTGSENFSDTLMNIGTGSLLEHTRNRLKAYILTLSYKGEMAWNMGTLDWGIRVREQHFKDKMNEWTRVDSAGYTVPWNEDLLEMTSRINSDNRLTILSYDSYLMNSGIIRTVRGKLLINTGLRGHFNTWTGEMLLSPRANAEFVTSERFSFHLTGGVYYQPPFYREMRYADGTLNRDIKSQRSVHTVLGMTYNFVAWTRPFRMTTEIYNKSLSNIIPYLIDNVRIIYTGENIAHGYSRGLDIRINGEFVAGAESWISVSFMDSKLEIPSYNIRRFPSPSDQTLSVQLFFQDWLPDYPSLRAHLNLSFATGIPITSPYNNRFDQYHRLPPYRRVDLGFTKLFQEKKLNYSSFSPFRFFDEIIAGLEIYNLLDIRNTVSYQWIRTVNNYDGQNRQFAVPNYLTGRSLNIRFAATF
jgi:hypothetical protein